MIRMRLSILLTFLAAATAALLVFKPEQTQKLSSAEQEPPLSVEGKATEQTKGPNPVELYRNQAKICVFRELVAGRCALIQTAMFFRILDELDPDFNRDAFNSAFSGKSSEERYCREIIVWAREEERDDGPEARKVRERLEAEFDRLVRNQTP